MEAVAQTQVQDATKQINTTEALVKDTPEATKPPSNDLASLARKEQMMRQQSRKLEQERAQFKKDREQWQKDLDEAKSLKAWKSSLKDDPTLILNEEGITYDGLTNALISNADPSSIQIRKLQAQINEMRAQQEASREELKNSKTQNYEQAKKQIRTSVNRIVDQDDQFEILKTLGDPAKDAVVQLIEDTFHEEGFVMDTADAIKEVEEYWTEYALKLSKLPKVQSKLKPLDEKSGEKLKTSEDSQKPTVTLSNRLTPLTPSNHSEKERVQRAILAYQGKLG